MNYDALMLGYRFGSETVFAEPPQTHTGSTGSTLSAAAGQSLEFREHRDYQPGDDLRQIDWNAYARSDRLTVKRYRDEIHPHVDLLLDVSKSMDLHGTKKSEATYALAGFFAAAAAESHFSFKTFITADGCQPLERSHLLPTDWQNFDLNAVVSPAEALNQLPPNWKPRSIRIVVSDFLFLSKPETVAAAVANESAETILVQLLAQDDTDPPERGNVRLTDCESGEKLELYLDPLTKERYKRNLTKHQENYHIAARKYGAVFCTVIAEQFLETERLDELFHRGILRYGSF
ncbi:MAG: DUF58 domain-containing protein [Planctomycetaceae bacterium]|jgi:hypothetical protein|nr:DUF58 domain-containing protein [Planctomycetaceae bacterium]